MGETELCDRISVEGPPDFSDGPSFIAALAQGQIP